MESDQCWRIAVVVPARDEAALVTRCVQSVRAAVAALPVSVVTYVVVVADACVDATADVARRALASSAATVVRCDAANVGMARRVGVDQALWALAPHPSARTWIAMTDADSHVPTDWLSRQLTAAVSGWHAVVRTIAVDVWRGRHPGTAGRLMQYQSDRRRKGHRPVHGANLGVRADALRSVGGVPGRALSEDAALVSALDRLELSVLPVDDLVVRTSARRSPRAPGGFSCLLDRLETAPLHAVSECEGTP